MNYKSIKHSFLIILIATTIIGCAGNSVQPPASQYQSSSESIDSRDDTSSIDVEDVDKEEMAKQESENSLRNDSDEASSFFASDEASSFWASIIVGAAYVGFMLLLPP